MRGGSAEFLTWVTWVIIGLVTRWLLEAAADDLCHPSCSCLDTFFDCRKKGLTEFPSDFPNWVQKLDLSRNKLEVLDSLRFQELKKLQELNLRRNHISNLSDAAFYGLDKIDSLYLDGNFIRLVEKRWLYGLRSLVTLNLSRNEISRIEDDSWEYMEELETLDISYNKLITVSKKSLLGLTKLRFLDISYNQLQGFEEDAFHTLEKLEILDISGNELSWVVEDMVAPFRGLSDCYSLNLASNHIRSVHPQALQGLQSLRVLNLSSNPISWLSQKPFQDVPPPPMTLLLGNVTSLICDCETTWLHSRLTAITSVPLREMGRNQRNRHRDGSLGINRSMTKKIAIPSPTCSYPPNLAGKSLLDVSVDELTCDDTPLRPVFTLHPKTQIFLMEGNGSLTCTAEAFGEIPPTTIWRKDNLELPKHLESQVENLERRSDNSSFQINSTLHLVNVSWVDAGRYKCIAQNNLGIVYSSAANITVHIFPSFVKKPSNVTVRLGSNAKLECAAKGFPTPEIAFHKDGGEDFPAALDRRFHVMPNDDSFFIMEVKLTDMGVYCCSARNAAGEIKAYATVTVFEAPSFIDPMEDESAVEGSNAILPCFGSGSPKPHIAWNKEGNPIVEGIDSRHHLTENGTFLVIKNVRSEDAGRYECLLSNTVGTARGFSTLTVLSGSSWKTWNLDTSAMTIIFIIIAVFCVVGTSAAWVVVIYRTRKRQKYITSAEAVGLRQSLSKYEDFEEIMQTSFTPSLPPLASHQIAKVQSGDSGSQSSSGKDSGTGDDLPSELDGGNVQDPEEEALMSRKPRRKKDERIEAFSTFGTRASTSRLSHSGHLDLGNGVCDVISLTHAPGREFHALPKRVPVPVVPPQVTLHRESANNTNSRTQSDSNSSGSSGYSSLDPSSSLTSTTSTAQAVLSSALNETTATVHTETVHTVQNNSSTPDSPNLLQKTPVNSVQALSIDGQEQSKSISTPV